MNSKVLEIKFPYLAALLLPVELRKQGLLAVLSVLTIPFSAVLALLTGMRRDKLQELKYNGQVCRLEYCLNYRFGEITEIENINYKDRIRVLDGTDSDGKPYIIYKRGVNAVYDKPKIRGERGQVILNRRAVNNQTFYNFTVECPKRWLVLSDNKNKIDEQKVLELRAVVNTYKTKGKIWNLVICN